MKKIQIRPPRKNSASDISYKDYSNSSSVEMVTCSSDPTSAIEIKNPYRIVYLIPAPTEPKENASTDQGIK